MDTVYSLTRQGILLLMDIWVISTFCGCYKPSYPYMFSSGQRFFFLMLIHPAATLLSSVVILWLFKEQQACSSVVPVPLILAYVLVMCETASFPLIFCSLNMICIYIHIYIHAYIDIYTLSSFISVGFKGFLRRFAMFYFWLFKNVSVFVLIYMWMARGQKRMVDTLELQLAGSSELPDLGAGN